MKKTLTGTPPDVYSPSMKLETPPRASKIPPRQCLRCGHTWYPRFDKLPGTCANTECRSPYWNRPRTRKATMVSLRKVQAVLKSSSKSR